MAQQAQDSFNADMPDGSTMTVHRGQVFPDNHPIVKIDSGRGLLFKPLEEVPEPKRPRGRPRKTTVAAVPPDDRDDDEDE